MTETQYRQLPEEIARTVEVVHGHIIKCEPPTLRHLRIARRLASALESARTPSNSHLRVETQIDLILWRAPRFTVRRPDAIVYECADDPPSETSTKTTFAVAEVASPTSAREDLIDKRAQYAAAGIPLYLVVIMDENYDIAEILEFHLDAAAAAYRLHAIHRSILDLEQPVRLTLPISDLLTG